MTTPELREAIAEAIGEASEPHRMSPEYCGVYADAVMAVLDEHVTTEWSIVLPFANAAIFVGGDPDDDDQGAVFYSLEAVKAALENPEPPLREVIVTRGVFSWRQQPDEGDTP